MEEAANMATKMYFDRPDVTSAGHSSPHPVPFLGRWGEFDLPGPGRASWPGVKASQDRLQIDFAGLGQLK